MILQLALLNHYWSAPTGGGMFAEIEQTAQIHSSPLQLHASSFRSLQINSKYAPSLGRAPIPGEGSYPSLCVLINTVLSEEVRLWALSCLLSLYSVLQNLTKVSLGYMRPCHPSTPTPLKDWQMVHWTKTLSAQT